jgi:hypothetical protein
VQHVKRIVGCLSLCGVLGVAGIAACGAVSSAATPPDLGGNLVDARALGACLRAAHPTKAWQLYREVKPQTAAAPAGLSIGAWKPSWGPGSKQSPQAPTYVEMLVFPSEAAATEFRGRFDYSQAADIVHQLHRWGNVVLWSEGGFPPRISGALKRCARASATLKSTDAGAFASCPDPPQSGVFKTLFIDQVSVRGGSCDQAIEELRQLYSQRGKCRLGAAFVCLGENICCSEFANYLGSGQIDVVYRYGI